MNIKYLYTEEFLKGAKALAKHYPSFKSDLQTFYNEYTKNPEMGDDLGDGVRKVRMAIASKGKGKRAGARIITGHSQMSVVEAYGATAELLGAFAPIYNLDLVA